MVEWSEAFHTVIQHYPNVTEDECGFGRESYLFDDSCFEYHKTEDIISKIKNGRNALKGELPFVVLIETKTISKTNERSEHFDSLKK